MGQASVRGREGGGRRESERERAAREPRCFSALASLIVCSSPLHTQALASSSLMPDPAGRGRRVSEREGRRRVEEAIGAREQTSVYFFLSPRQRCAFCVPGHRLALLGLKQRDRGRQTSPCPTGA